MFLVTREIHFCYGHRLLGYEGKCQHLHGHNGKLIITLRSDALDEQGMVFDFAKIKGTLSAWIDVTLDHRMILHRDDPAVPLFKQLGEPVFLMENNPTAENIARLIYQQAQLQGLPVAKVELWETPQCSAIFCPSTEPGAALP